MIVAHVPPSRRDCAAGRPEGGAARRTRRHGDESDDAHDDLTVASASASSPRAAGMPEGDMRGNSIDGSLDAVPPRR